MFIIQTRFSIFNKNIDASAWQIGRGEDIDVLKRLLDEERLKLRCNIFFGHSLPNIDKASSNGHLILHTVPHYKDLPQWVLNKFDEAKERYSWFKPIPIGYDEDLSFFGIIRDVTRKYSVENGLDTQIPCAGIRLDDDDLIGPKYFERLKPYVQSHFDGFCISLANGVAAEWKDGRYIQMAKFYEAKTALGLAQINLYDAKLGKFLSPHLLPPGSHPTVDLRVPTILDSRGDPVFVRTFHDNNDIFANADISNNQRYMARIFKDKIEFCVDKNL